MQRVLITGGCGFLGSAYLQHCLSSQPDLDVTNFDALTYSAQPDRLAYLEHEPRYQFIRGDVSEARDTSALFRAHGPFDRVVHFAAETHVDRSLRNAVPFVQSNVLGTQNLLDAFRAQNTGQLIHISTDEVYGPAPAGVFLAEDAPLRPRNPYAATKAAADHLVQAAVRSFGLDAWIVRSVNVYGPGQYPEKLIPLAVTTLLSGGKVPLYGDGAQVRDWLYVDDFVRAVGCVEEHGRPGEIYHVSAQDERSNRRVAEMICALCEVPVAEGVELVDDRPGHDRRYGLDSARLRALGWQPEVDFGTGLRRTVEYFRAHPHRPSGARPD
jgi:dTDP-glucose 4,6-dehydratase